MILSTAVLCLAMNLYHEARGEPIMGQYAVAHVTLNRANGDHDRVCEEVFKPKQFSWTNKHVKRKSNGWWIAERLHPKEQEAWKRAKTIARVALSGRMIDFTDGAKFYHATRVRPYWTVAMEQVKHIGNHVFYRQVSRS